MKRKLLSDYGMLLVLVALCTLFSLLTINRRMPEGVEAVDELSSVIRRDFAPSDLILAVGARNRNSASMAESLGNTLVREGYTNVEVVVGTPRDL